MILIDDRIGSKEMLDLFKPYGLRVDSTRLEFGDACWAGNGPEGDCMIGLERKRITDLVSSMRDGRLSGHQLPGLFSTYQYVYLAVEGIYKPGDNGELIYWKGAGFRPVMCGRNTVMYREVDAYLSTLETKAGVVVRRTGRIEETVAQIVSLYHWWQKPWEKHQSHQQIYAPVPQGKRMGFVSREELIRRKYGEKAVVAWKMAAQLPGLDTKAESVAKHFRCPFAMIAATPEEWMQIKGIGKKLAERYADLMGGN